MLQTDGLPTFEIIPDEQMRLDLNQSYIELRQGSSNEYNVILYVEMDNQDEENLPIGFRRWWHFQMNGLVGSEVLYVTLIGAEYPDIILPIWSLNGGEYERCPSSAMPTYSNSKHTFTIHVPAQTHTLRLAKFYPYTLPMLDNLREKILSNPLITEHVIGQSEQGRDMYVWEIATEETEQKNSPRVYVQAGIHPSETTSYYVVEGFLDWIFSDSEEAKELLSMAVISIVPMCNPDGVALGNYRTNSKSVNLEMEYSAPYNSQVKETIAIVQLVEKYMGDSSSPGAHPIQILMNLHSTHGDDYPYHFHHYPYYLINGTGITPEVFHLEESWIQIFKEESKFVSQGITLMSSLSTRAYIESMMHDRWSVDSNYNFPDVMAITLEGVYHYGPDRTCCNSQDDYRQLGVEMGRSFIRFLSL